jgi:hypothetical protein
MYADEVRINGAQVPRFVVYRCVRNHHQWLKTAHQNGRVSAPGDPLASVTAGHGRAIRSSVAAS